MKRLAIILVLLLPLQLLAAVKILKGVVIDGISQKPIEGAFVFINQSMQYSLTDSAGQFLIRDSLAPDIEIVVSRKGYETLVYRLTGEKAPPSFKFELLRRNVPGHLATDSLKNKFEEIFLQSFIGMSINTRETVIANKETLLFTFNDTTGVLNISSNGMLQIINDGLGYMIFYDLADFSYSVSAGNAFFSGHCFFKNLSTTNEAVKIKWKERRQLAYAGSLLQFNRSLFNHSLWNRGFRLHKITRMSENDKGYKAAQRSAAVIRNGAETIDGKRIEFIEVVDKDTIPITDLVSIDEQGKTVFHSVRPLIVDYKKQTRTILGLLVNEELLPVSTYSLLNFSNQKIQICQNGLYFDKSDLLVQGFMKEKMADLLPVDY